MASSSSSTTTTTNSGTVSETETFKVDYRAANEFIQAHYSGLQWNNEHSYYFGSTPCNDDDNDNDRYDDYFYRKEQVWNARKGVIDPNHDNYGAGAGASSSTTTTTVHGPTIQQNGFTLFHHPTHVQDFTDFSQIQNRYLPELKTLLQQQQLQITDDTHHILFWNPVLRGTHIQSQDRQFNDTTKTIMATALSTTAGMVHIDTDIGAHPTAEQFVHTMYKNRVLSGKDEYTFTAHQLAEEITNGKHFMIFNFWRNADPQNPIIQQSPLGLFYPHYDQIDLSNQPCCCFPNARPNSETSRWYYFPNMTYDECLVFKQYDRDARFVSDIWHTALKEDENKDHDDTNSNSNVPVPPRTSFDIRALIISKTKTVPHPHDRYSNDRPKPQLDEEEADEYAEEQDRRQTERGY